MHGTVLDPRGTKLIKFGFLPSGLGRQNSATHREDLHRSLLGVWDRAPGSKGTWEKLFNH